MFECECTVVCRSLLAWFELQHTRDIECRISVERKWTSISAISAKTVEMFKESENVLEKDEKKMNRKKVVFNFGDKIVVRATQKDFNQHLRIARRAAEVKWLGSVCSMTNTDGKKKIVNQQQQFYNCCCATIAFQNQTKGF